MTNHRRDIRSGALAAAALLAISLAGCGDGAVAVEGGESDDPSGSRATTRASASTDARMFEREPARMGVQADR